MERPGASPARTVVPRRVDPDVVFSPDSSEDLSRLSAHLTSHGYAVVGGVLTSAECDEALRLMWDWLEGLGTGIVRDDPDTWGDDRWPPTVEGGVVPWWGIGQSDACWLVRSRPAVRAPFDAIWSDLTNNKARALSTHRRRSLISSFEGMSIWRSVDARAAGKRGECNSAGDGSCKTVHSPPAPLPWHVDQHPCRPGRCTVQSLVDLLGTDVAGGRGNALVPRSHIQFTRWAGTYPALVEASGADDYFEVPPGDPIFDRTDGLSGSAAVAVSLRAGDMLMWDSRVVHCNTIASAVAPPREAGIPLAGLTRAVCYVCMTPREGEESRDAGGCLSDRTSTGGPPVPDEAAIAARREAIETGVTTTHAPWKCESTAKFAQYYPDICHDGAPPPRPTPYVPPKMDAASWDLV